MASEYPPLNKIYVFGYSANDRDYPILSATADPRVAGYQVPKDLSACPDKRYPNHVFTGAQPISGDQRVRHVWEILPSPWVAFTRYDDDLGPIQGRRRSVKNEGQVASLTADKRTTYEAREGSAIVYTELEETWNIGSADDEESPFPITIRDFYDEKFGAVQDKRQLVVATGNEVGSLSYEDPTVTQISYEPYNEYLLVKTTRTFDLPCPKRHDNLYDNARGAIQRVSEVIYDDKTYSGSVVELNGVVTQTVYQSINEILVDKIVETLSTTGPVRNGRQTGTWGVESSSSQTVDATTEASQGFGIKASSVTPINSEHSEKQIENYPSDSDNDGIIYTLIGQEQDETSRSVIKIEKSLVEAETLESGRVANYISNLRNNGYIVEVQPLDKWHSITIASKIVGAPQNESWTETGSINLPDELLEVGVIWNSDTDKDEGTSGVDNIPEIINREYNWTVQAKAVITGRVSGRIYTKVRGGYNGAAKMSVARSFSYGAPTANIAIHNFKPVYGTISIYGISATNSATSNTQGIGSIKITSGTSSGYNYDDGVVIDQFGPIEHDGVVLTEKGDPKVLVDTATASGGSTPSGGLYPTVTAGINLAGAANLELPASSTPLKSGDVFIRQVSVQPWRFGWWVREVYTATVP